MENSLKTDSHLAQTNKPNLFKKSTVCVIITIILVALLAVFWQVSGLMTEIQIATTRRNAILLSKLLEGFRSLYSSEVVSRAEALGIEARHDYAANEYAIPLPATLSMMLGEHINKSGVEAKTRLYSDYPFPWRRKEGGANDDFERDAIKYLQKDPTLPFTKTELFEGRPSLRFATADLMRQSCVGCHNTHPDSPKKDWKKGDVRGVLEVILPLNSDGHTLQAKLNTIKILLAVVGGMIVLLTVLFFAGAGKK